MRVRPAEAAAEPAAEAATDATGESAPEANASADANATAAPGKVLKKKTHKRTLTVTPSTAGLRQWAPRRSDVDAARDVVGMGLLRRHADAEAHDPVGPARAAGHAVAELLLRPQLVVERLVDHGLEQVRQQP